MPTIRPATFVLALSLVCADIQVNASMRRPNAVLMFAMMALSCAFDSAGKYFATYIFPTAGPNAALVASTARFQRSRCLVVPVSAVP